MGSNLVVVNHPPMGCLHDLRDAVEQVQAQDLLAVGVVKPRNVRVLVRLARLDVLDGYPSHFAPRHEVRA